MMDERTARGAAGMGGDSRLAKLCTQLQWDASRLGYADCPRARAIQAGGLGQPVAVALRVAADTPCLCHMGWTLARLTELYEILTNRR